MAAPALKNTMACAQEARVSITSPSRWPREKMMVIMPRQAWNRIRARITVSIVADEALTLGLVRRRYSSMAPPTMHRAPARPPMMIASSCLLPAEMKGA
ncbi:hypothetical protein D3C80_2018580 [compost metagenome]